MSQVSDSTSVTVDAQPTTTTNNPMKTPKDEIKNSQGTIATPSGFLCGVASTSIFFVSLSALSIIAVGVGVGFGRPVEKEKVVEVVEVEMPFWPSEPEEIGDAIWNYDLDSEEGPLFWGEIHKISDHSIAYPTCAGTHQSPVDIPSFPSTATTSSPLITNYPQNNMQIVSRPSGHPGFQLKDAQGVTTPGTWTVDGDVYNFLQFHYHSPSEHTVNGQYYPLEVHFVHQKVGSSGTNDLAVFGILYNYTQDGTRNQALDEFWLEIHHVQPSLSGVLIQQMFNQAGPVYQRYHGSLTTPPCSETVKWHVAESTVGVNQLQKLVYKYALNGIDNYRPTNPLSGRTISQYAK